MSRTTTSVSFRGRNLEAGRRLRKRQTITAAEAAGWEVLDGLTVIWRSAPAVATAPIAELGEAIIGLVRGTLPEPPRGTWWLFGTHDGPGTIAMDADGPASPLFDVRHARASARGCGPVGM